MKTEWVVAFHITGTQADAERWKEKALRILDGDQNLYPKDDDVGAFCSGHVLGMRGETVKI